jgi:hypothetical protein
MGATLTRVACVFLTVCHGSGVIRGHKKNRREGEGQKNPIHGGCGEWHASGPSRFEEWVRARTEGRPYNLPQPAGQSRE